MAGCGGSIHAEGSYAGDIPAVIETTATCNRCGAVYSFERRETGPEPPRVYDPRAELK
jgi:hypothetical protein